MYNCVVPFTSHGKLHEFGAKKPISWAKSAHFDFFANKFYCLQLHIDHCWRCSNGPHQFPPHYEAMLRSLTQHSYFSHFYNGETSLICPLRSFSTTWTSGMFLMIFLEVQSIGKKVGWVANKKTNLINIHSLQSVANWAWHEHFDFINVCSLQSVANWVRHEHFNFISICSLQSVAKWVGHGH